MANPAETRPDHQSLYSPAGNLVRGEGSGQAFAYDVEGKLRIADDGVAAPPPAADQVALTIRPAGS